MHEKRFLQLPVIVRHKIQIIPETEKKSFRDFRVFEFALMLNTKTRKSA